MFGKPWYWHLRLGLVTFAIGTLPITIYYWSIGYSLPSSNPGFVDSFCDAQDCQCMDWERLAENGYLIENNVWNKEGVDHYQQCVYLEANNEVIDAGWAWNWPGLRLNVVAYPSLVYGKKPWFTASTTHLLPQKISELNCLTADFSVDQTGKTNGNLAFDLWLTNDKTANPESITRELMIWLTRNGAMVAGKRVDTFISDGYEIELWRKDGHDPTEGLSWTLLTFVHQTDRTEGPINLIDYLDFLVENNYISDQEYLADVELGNELINGYGKTLIHDFKVTQCED